LPNKIKIVIFVIVILAVVFLIANLVWGKTARMAKANQLFAKSQIDKAKAIYEDLAVDLPKSPYVLHNIGLSNYKKGDYDPSAEYLKNSLKELVSLKQSPGQKKEDLDLNYYHLGSALFQSAAKNAQNQSGNSSNSSSSSNNSSNSSNNLYQLYQDALDNFHKAIENNPKDLDAKYNYELTRLRLNSMDQQQSQDQNQDKNQDQNKNENKDQNKNENKNANQENANQQQANPETKQPKDQNQMSKEEVESLLKMNENNDQYQTPVIISNNQAPEKDW
jgi:hypothetical protein